MISEQPLFSQDDLDLARHRIAQGSRRPIDKALRFQAALKALIMDASRLQRESDAKTLLAVDSVEIISLIDYGRPHFSAFSFNGLLGGGGDSWDQALENLDHMVSLRFFERRDSPFLLLDSYFNELLDVRNAIDLRAVHAVDTLFANVELNNRQFNGFTTENIERIKQFVVGQKSTGRAKEELNLFTEEFLPHWRIDLIDTLLEHSEQRDSLDATLANGNYVHIRDDSFGIKALKRGIDGFNWREFEKFLDKESVADEFEAVQSAVEELCGSVLRFGKSQNAISKAAQNDGKALADIHILNTFLEQQDDERRVELISRSPLLHDVVRALPSGRLKVQLRHPLLLPEAFQFSEGAIAAISDIAQRFDAVITPYLEDYENGLSVENGGAESIEQEKWYFANAAEVAKDLVSWLRDTSLVQVGKDIDKDKFTDAYARGVTGKGREAALSDAMIAQVRQLFDLIIEHLEMKDNPLTRAALQELVRKNSKLASIVWGRKFQDNSKIKTRILIIENPSIAPQKLVAVRMIEGSQTRLFHLHSKMAQDLIRDKLPPDIVMSSVRPSEGEPIEIELTREETLGKLTDLLEKLQNDDGISDPTDRDRAFVNDVTLLVAIALASRGETTTAVSLASTVLHELTSMMRLPGTTIKGLSPELRFSYQELLLFRHYCERQIGISEFCSQKQRSTVTFLRGSVEKSYARAQRDLDFAATLGDVDLIDGIQPPIRDLQLRMVHMSGWMDLYLLTSDLDLMSGEAAAGRPLVRLTYRRDIWAALGFVKEAVDDARRVKILAEKIVSDFEAARYLANLEARLLQNALVMFLLLLFGKEVPMMNRWLDPTHSILPEHVLKFGSWETWWKRFRELVEEHKFEFRLGDIFNIILQAIKDISEVREDTSRSVDQKKTDGRTIRANAVDLLAEQRMEATGFLLLLIDHILSELAEHSSDV